MTEYKRRIAIVEQSPDHYYIGIQFYYGPHKEWITDTRLTKRYPSYKEADQARKSLEKLGYLDPALYSHAM